MGWNDRLPEDPYWPEQNIDRDSYENWCAYVEYQFSLMEKEGLTSQNIAPAEFIRRTDLHFQEMQERPHANQKQKEGSQVEQGSAHQVKQDQEKSGEDSNAATVS